MKTFHRIYSLSGKDGVVRYVGRTRCPLNERYAGHIASSKMGQTRRDLWVKEQGDNLIMSELEFIEHADVPSFYQPCCYAATDAENRWIKHFLSSGHDLLNVNQRGKSWDKNIIYLPIERPFATIEAGQ